MNNYMSHRYYQLILPSSLWKHFCDNIISSITYALYYFWCQNNTTIKILRHASYDPYTARSQHASGFTRKSITSRSIPIILISQVSIWRPHYCNVIMGAMASQITSLTTFTQPFVQAQIKENIKPPRHCPFCAVNSPVTGVSPAQMRHHGMSYLELRVLFFAPAFKRYLS